ncbi:hypothetical protein G6M89_03480 [Natronolimnobius sp. AArcel1]|uniref:hypothetical protein n=1 Tax=Natronolimnobius sp. AArcel1 TaxID=1679093 RepID=UPI0013EAEB3E|nr:hypothetical protein [Natronolimnobius sp. AArcel1]NGM68081.1 hypothetical protein [Natronolimnobius sp. AArcel1]
MVPGCSHRLIENTGGTDSETSNADSSIQGAEPQLTPGEEATLTLTATDVSSLTFNLPDSIAGINYSFNPDGISPTPDNIDYSYPPGWSWENPTSVDLEIPISVSHDATPGEYQYSLEKEQTDDDEPVTETFQITILDDA